MKLRLLPFILCSLSLLVNAQTFNHHTSLNLQLSSDTTLHPFNGSNVTSIGVSGHVSFTSEMGFVRFVVSNSDEAYQIYESYRLFEIDSVFDFVQKCDESCFFDSFIPTNIEVQVQDAIVTISYLETGNSIYENAETLRINAANLARAQKLSKVQNYIQNNGLIWNASQTTLSKMSYKQKEELWGKGYRSYGYEFYSKGFYSLFGPHRYASCKNTLSDFDWRNRHGANDSLSPYYDNDTSGTGWITPVVCQSEGCWINDSFECYLNQEECSQLGGEYREASTCWVFGPSAQVEAMTNLYYNQHVDVDVSEQYIVCKAGSISSGYPSVSLDYFKNGGVPFESCLSYSASLGNCDELCPDSLNRVGISDYILYNQNQLNDSLLKQKLIHEGPLTASSLPLGLGFNHHCMTLVGWGTIDNKIISDVLGVPLDSNGSYDMGFLGLTYWIYKESIGTDVGDNGFKYILHIDNEVPSKTYSIITPVNYLDWTEVNVSCNDYDGDGYYYWGIGPKPSHCPPCPDEPDGDDSNPNLGPINDYGQCSIIGTYTAGFEDGWNHWIQPDWTQSNLSNEGTFWRFSGPTSAGLTGPTGAQEGDYYLCVNSRTLQNYHHKYSIIESPDIDISDPCGILLDFYFHMKIYDWHSGEEDPYIKLSTLRSNGTWSVHYPSWSAKGDHGSEWQHVSMLLPTDVKKVRFIVKTGNYQYSDIAIDNITIGPWIHNQSPIVINGIEEWRSNLGTTQDLQVINRNVIVESGGVLTIKKAGNNSFKIKIQDDCMFIVKPGGRLILDGCRLQGSCGNEMWPGIEVWGNSNANQQEVNGSYQQGYVELKNGATIENARCALRLRNPLVNGTSGGIVHATDAVFLNNALAVEASNYTNHGSGQRELDYNGWFKNCSFTVDDDFPGQAAFHSHASLSNVNGIAFNGCSFTTDRSVDSVDFFCTGIAAYDASFHVTDYCDSHMLPCPSGSLVRSSFSGFHRGVGSVNDGQSTRTFSVKESDFTGNDIGIFALNASTATALANNFNVGGLTDCSFGIYLEGVALCRVEENDFSKAPGTSSVTYGVSVKNSQAANDIYRNQFNGLSYGNIATGRNAIVTEIGGIPSVTTGLTYTCNSNESNIVDFRIADDGDYAGIQPVQGSATVAAGNTFSGSQWHIYNDGDYTLGYHYDALDPDQTPTASKLYRVNATASARANRCLTHYGDSPVKQSPEGIDSLSVRWAEARAAFESLRRLYEAQAGNETADADPDATDRILAEMTEKAHLATEAAGDILRSLANEPGSDPDEMRRWLAALECPDADRIAIASLLEQGDIDEALAQAQSMADKYDQKRLDPKEHADYIRLVSLYADLRLSGRSALELTEEEISLVEDMVAEGTGHARLLAKALLEGTGRGQGLTLCPADIIEENRNLSEEMGKPSYNNVKENKQRYFRVNVVPSPAKDYATIQYTLPSDNLHAFFDLYSMTGIRMMTLELDGRQISRSINLNNIPAGIYTYVVYCDGSTRTGKMVVSE